MPERRLFIQSEDHIRFVRLRPGTQLAAWIGSGAFIAWSVVVTSVLLANSISGGNVRAQAERDRYVYEDRLNTLAAERDLRAEEAAAAQARFTVALQQVSVMQSELLTSGIEIRELATGLEAAQALLRRTFSERDTAQTEVADLVARKEIGSDGPAADNLAATLDLMTGALAETSAERDRLAAETNEAVRLAGDLDLELRLMEERSDGIFQEIEDALTISVEPLDDVFRAAGLDPEELLDAVGRDGSGEGGSLTSIQISTMGAPGHDDATLRANRILDRLDQINLYRVAVEQVPLAMPVRDAFRYTSGFGPRWGRRHEGVDMAGPMGTPVYATADGVVTFAGWQNGFGRIVIVQHAFGIETRYPHLNAIRAEVGQQVSVGEQVGDMGSSGRSTGPHLHYEIRIDGRAIDPMTYIRAGQAL